jgi:Zn-dependent protease with chaperone function
MTKDSREILTEEFTNARDRWANVRIEMMMRFGDQRSVIADRQFNLNIALISIAAAFLTIVVPVTGVVGGNFSNDFIIATIFLFACAILGVCHVLWTIRKDQREMTEDNQWRLKILKEHETRAGAIRSLLLDDTVPNKDIQSYFKDEETLIVKMRERALERQHSLHTRIVSVVQYIFLFSFFFGFIFLAVALFPQFESLRF